MYESDGYGGYEVEYQPKPALGCVFLTSIRFGLLTRVINFTFKANHSLLQSANQLMHGFVIAQYLVTKAWYLFTNCLLRNWTSSLAWANPCLAKPLNQTYRD